MVRTSRSGVAQKYQNHSANTPTRNNALVPTAIHMTEGARADLLGDDMQDASEANRQQFSAMLKDARLARGQHQYEVAQATGVNQNTIGLLERAGPYPGLRAIDLFKLIAYYGLDVNRVAELLGVSITATATAESSPLAPLLPQFEVLSAEQQQYVIGVINVILRGMRR